MTASARSLFVFGIYVFGTGLLILSIPDQFISLLQLPSIPVHWARFIGLLALVIGAYDMFAGKQNILPFIKASVFVRFGFMLGTVLLFVSGQMPITIILLGSVDALGAVWTSIALRSEAKLS